MIISFFFPGNVNLSAVTPVPLTWTSCHLLYLAWKCILFPITIYLPCLSLIVYVFFSWNHDWVLLWQFGLKMLSGGKIINMDQYSLTCAMSQVASLHFYPIHLSSITEFCRRLCFKISVGMIFFFFWEPQSSLGYHQTKNSEDSKADSRAVLSRLAGDCLQVGVQYGIIGESSCCNKDGLTLHQFLFSLQ